MAESAAPRRALGLVVPAVPLCHHHPSFRFSRWRKLFVVLVLLRETYRTSSSLLWHLARLLTALLVRVTLVLRCFVFLHFLQDFSG